VLATPRSGIWLSWWGLPDFLADLWPLVIDVVVWAGAMNAPEPPLKGDGVIERYAWRSVVMAISESA
jgi:hypothetical protein